MVHPEGAATATEAEAEALVLVLVLVLVEVEIEAEVEVEVEVDEGVVEVEVEVDEAVVELVAVTGMVLLVFDLNAVIRQEAPHLEYMSPEHAILHSEAATIDPPWVFPQ